MSREESIKYAKSRLVFNKTKDKKYNNGMRDVHNGNYYTDDAQYYFLCNGK